MFDMSIFKTLAEVKKGSFINAVEHMSLKSLLTRPIETINANKLIEFSGIMNLSGL